jgi:hypothetical protein
MDGGLRAPAPRPGQPSLSVLEPPFQGLYLVDNVFDHTRGRRPPGEGELLSFDGQLRLGTRNHRGYDWPLPVGTPVLAAAGGVVRIAGALPAFSCPALGREVDDQLAVVLTHTLPDGTVLETGYHHLARVDVEEGANVVAGAVLGASGASGCALGPHLHFQVERRVDRALVPVDPFGWSGQGDDPWASDEGSGGSPSVWLWRRAPPWYRESSWPPTPGAPVSIVRLRSEGWRDAEDPSQEFVELALGPDVDLTGWSLQTDQGDRLALPAHPSRTPEGRLRIAGGGDADAGWPGGPHLVDGGGVVSLRDPAGREVQRVAWGLAARRGASRVDAGLPSCPGEADGCVPMPKPGPVASLAWSPSGRYLAWTLGETGSRVIAWADLDAAERVVHLVDVEPIRSRDLDGAVDAANPAWLSDDVLVFDVATAEGARRVVHAVPGWLASDVVAWDALPGSLEVAGVAPGELLLARTDQGSRDLWSWRPGEGRARQLTRDRRDELGPRRLPHGDLVFFRAGELYVLREESGQETTVATGLMGSPRLAVWQRQVLWLSAGVPKTAPDPAPGERAAAWLGPGVTAVDATELAIAAVDAAGVVRVGSLEGPSEGPSPTLPIAPSELAVAVRNGQLRVAWVAPVAPGAPPALGLHQRTWAEP